jgi:hypothetical protein
MRHAKLRTLSSPNNDVKKRVPAQRVFITMILL